MAAKKNDDNVIVIDFPKRSPRSEKDPQVEPGHPSPAPAPKKARRPSKGVVAGVIATLAVPLLSQFFSQTQSETSLSSRSSRGLASVESSLYLGERDEAFERQMVSQIRDVVERAPSSLSLGRSPSAEEKLRYDILKGEYRVVMNEQVLSEVTAAAAPESSSALVYVLDGKEFLAEQKLLLPKGFERAHLESEERSATGVSELYRLEGSGSQSLGKVAMNYDPHRRLISLKVLAPTSAQ